MALASFLVVPSSVAEPTSTAIVLPFGRLASLSMYLPLLVGGRRFGAIEAQDHLVRDPTCADAVARRCKSNGDPLPADGRGRLNTGRAIAPRTDPSPLSLRRRSPQSVYYFRLLRIIARQINSAAIEFGKKRVLHFRIINGRNRKRYLVSVVAKNQSGGIVRYRDE